MIREARISDIEQIAHVHISSWHSTYSGIISEEYLNNLSIEAKVEQWTYNLTIDRTFMYVASVDNRIVGFINGGPNRSNEFRYEGEIYALYLLENYQGRGIGRELFNRVISTIKCRGWNSMLVWVLEENSSKFFYEKMGGQKVGKDTLEVKGTSHIELAYGWDEI
ncbi:GNAT family N-acetyltransferase [Pseudalkalibacillus berkeleyi]|uniref:GNAT family N-acetyltransferase n=1 Tax=Pseudalkalibacillus berkeleyi TaxID=1069813 RepID=A0ABS9GX88_9BACL|nr:GNAT family N-acetyltransferase [Pseudalkalibacillus berkeleyi]MCF6137304.1 GNAT family N-acetyltransferase [Pseudalkalibacillus berkeleyi]